VETAAQARLWDLIDAVLVINLDQRPERWSGLLAAASGLIPAGKIHRVPAILGRNLDGFGQRPWFRGRRRDQTWAARAGCMLSHRLALDIARNNNWKTVLVLEDDVEFSPDLLTLAGPMHDALTRLHDQWQVCYLGFTDPVGPFQTLARLDANHQLVRIYGCNCAHAYMLRVDARDWILAQLPSEKSPWSWLSRHRAVDRWYRGKLGARFHVSAISPSVVNQRPGFSDIVGMPTDYAVAGRHHLTVPPTSTSDAGFTCGSRLRRLGNLLGDSYDALRGLGKRLRGF
jgi:glycosyl transferase, family 25